MVNLHPETGTTAVARHFSSEKMGGEIPPNMFLQYFLPNLMIAMSSTATPAKAPPTMYCVVGSNF